MFDNNEHAAKMSKKSATKIDRLNKYEVIADMAGCHPDYVRMIDRGARLNTKNELHQHITKLLGEWEPRTKAFISQWVSEHSDIGGAPCQSK